jgi:hypothetical protein
VITTGSSRAIGYLRALRVLSISLQAAVIVAAALGVYWQFSSYWSSPKNTFVIRLLAGVGRPTTGAGGYASPGKPPTLTTFDERLRPSAELTAESNWGFSRPMFREVTGIGRFGNRVTIKRSNGPVPIAACEACPVLPATRFDGASGTVRKLAGNRKRIAIPGALKLFWPGPEVVAVAVTPVTEW